MKNSLVSLFLVVIHLFLQGCDNSVDLAISYAKKEANSKNNLVIKYQLKNNTSGNIKVYSNPVIGYKSDKISQGYFEIETKNNKDWVAYLETPNDYNYRLEGLAVTLSSNSKVEGIFDVYRLFRFKKGVYRLRLYLLLPSKQGSIFSNWLYFTAN